MEQWNNGLDLDGGANRWHNLSMAYALARENEEFISRMIRQGRYNNQSEVVREALRRMERTETDYLNPPPLTEKELRQIYGRNTAQEQQERLAAERSQRSMRRLIKESKLTLQDL